MVEIYMERVRDLFDLSKENIHIKDITLSRHTLSRHNLIGNKKELFHFDVHEDVRTIADATIEKDESHVGKVVERHWYEKNKHIFPASRWEVQRKVRLSISKEPTHNDKEL